MKGNNTIIKFIKKKQLSFYTQLSVRLLGFSALCSFPPFYIHLFNLFFILL